jgi:hypothetical protein
VKPIEAVDERKAGTLKMLSGKCPSVTGSITLHSVVVPPKFLSSFEQQTGLMS